jgi:hypothetical protein
LGAAADRGDRREDRDDQVNKSLLVEINQNLVAAGVVAADDGFPFSNRRKRTSGPGTKPC